MQSAWRSVAPAYRGSLSTDDYEQVMRLIWSATIGIWGQHSDRGQRQRRGRPMLPSSSSMTSPAVGASSGPACADFGCSTDVVK